ncbi:MAG: response regulator [Desulfuromonadaceae bacterium]|nr:response regulator [Desulfuromonadaceae bacterium]
MVPVIIAGATQELVRSLQQVAQQAGGHPEAVANVAEAVTALRTAGMPGVLLLSQTFDGSNALELIPIFRQCQKGVKIILLADTDSVGFLRQARSSGIFYHTLEPRTDEDCDELRLAIESAREACEKQSEGLWSKVAMAFH